MLTSLRGIAKKAKEDPQHRFGEMMEYFKNTTSQNNRLLELTKLLYEANNIEEPCARKPHAGICEGAVG